MLSVGGDLDDALVMALGGTNVRKDEFGDCSTVVLLTWGVESNVLHMVGFVAVIKGFDGPAVGSGSLDL